MQENNQEEPVTINDRRRINPETGEARQTEPPSENSPETASGVTAESENNSATTDQEMAELTETLQRLQAEFANYKKRIEKERLEIVDTGRAIVINELLPIFDDLDLAKSHNDLTTEPLKTIAEKLHNILKNQQVQAFTAVGDTFNPNIHEAVQNSGTSHNLVVENVLRVGYRLGEKVLRTALVTVTDAATPTEEAATTDSSDKDK